MKEAPAATIEYGLKISAEIERRLSRCRVSIRKAIRDRLQEVAIAAGKTRLRVAKGAEKKQPPLRFYVYEGYRVFYQVDPETRRVIVLDLRVAVA
jgi:mRNA-degrading endonuclease RelE of RelBE toxin-antitoxin system